MTTPYRMTLVILRRVDLAWDWAIAAEHDLWSGQVSGRSADEAILTLLEQEYPSWARLLPVQLTIDQGCADRLYASRAELALIFPGVQLVRAARFDRELCRRASAEVPSTVPTVVVPVGPPLEVATDGSAKDGHIGWGWLAEDGTYDMLGFAQRRSQVGTELATIAELRAIGAAIQSHRGRRLTIATDSRKAIDFVDDWMAGGTRLPHGYTTTRRHGGPSGLQRLQSLVHRERDRLQIRWVRGHAGEPLNEGADGLARLARRFASGRSGLSNVEYHQRARGLAEAFAEAARVDAAS